eukprot:UN08359
MNLINTQNNGYCCRNIDDGGYCYYFMRDSCCG